MTDRRTPYSADEPRKASTPEEIADALLAPFRPECTCDPDDDCDYPRWIGVSQSIAAAIRAERERCNCFFRSRELAADDYAPDPHFHTTDGGLVNVYACWRTDCADKGEK